MLSNYHHQILDRVQAEPTVLHAITLVHPETGDEKRITVWSQSESFTDVHFAVSRKCAELGLKGYEIFEAPRIDLDFAALLDRMGAGAMLIQLRKELAHRIGSYHPDRELDILEAIAGLSDIEIHADAIDYGNVEERNGEWAELRGGWVGVTATAA